MLKRIRERVQTQEGFTLIELLIVIVILGILAAIVVFAVGAFQNEGETAACEADAKSLAVAAEAFKAKTGSYPANVAALTAGGYLRDAPTSGATLGANGAVTGC